MKEDAQDICISQETLDELVDTLEAIRANTSKSEVALRNMITAVASLTEVRTSG